jgi:hypothetical protein
MQKVDSASAFRSTVLLSLKSLRITVERAITMVARVVVVVGRAGRIGVRDLYGIGTSGVRVGGSN